MDTTPAHHLLIVFSSQSSLPASTASELPPLQSEPPKRDLRGNNNPGLSRIALSGQRCYPGTSCLATISLSLRDKRHSSIEAPRITLALMGLKPLAESWSPFGAKSRRSSSNRREKSVSQQLPSNGAHREPKDYLIRLTIASLLPVDPPLSGSKTPRHR